MFMGESHYQIVKRDHRENYGCKVIDSKKYKIKKPTIFCLGGNGCVSVKEANGFCKIAENLVGLNYKEDSDAGLVDLVDIVGIVYGAENSQKMNAYGLSNFCTGIFSGEEVDEFVNDILLPLCKDDDGNALPIEEACRNFSLITFFTYCYGAVALISLLYNLSVKLKALGYSDGEIHKLMGSTMQITYASLSFGCPVPTLEVVSKEDLTIGDFYYEKGCFSKGVNLIHHVANEYFGKKSKTRDFESIGIYSSRLRNFQKKGEDEHAVKIISRDKEWRSIYEDKNLDIVSQMVGYALAKSVVNSIDNSYSKKFVPKCSLLELLWDLDDIKSTYSEEELLIMK